MPNHRSFIGISIILAYFAATIVIGWFARRKHAGANDLLNASRSLPLWIVSSAFLAANCGALEIVGISAMAAQYGVQAFHFYWIGAIPGMIFVSLWMLPAYVKSGARSVPEYLGRRYDHRVRLLNACILMLTMVMLSGISLYAMAQVLHVVFDLSYAHGVLVSAFVVLSYVLLGGIRATIYNEVFQLVVILAGLLPLMFQTLRVAGAVLKAGGPKAHLWTALPVASTGAPLDIVGVVGGLGVVLSFSYWGTDFILMQRALATRSDLDARRVPVLAGFGKLFISFVMVLPGIAAARLFPQLSTSMRYDEVLPALMEKLYGPALLGIGLTALIAGLTAGLAANISGIAAIWTEDIYRPWIHTSMDEAHYMRVGWIATVAAMVLGSLCSGVSFYFGDLMEHVQLIFSLFSAPFGAIFLMGIATRRVNATGAIIGFVSGLLVALTHHALVVLGRLHYGSMMSANFHVAIYGFLSTIVVSWVASPAVPSNESHSLAGFEAVTFPGKLNRNLILLVAVLLLACVYLNWLWR